MAPRHASAWGTARCYTVLAFSTLGIVAYGGAHACEALVMLRSQDLKGTEAELAVRPTLEEALGLVAVLAPLAFAQGFVYLMWLYRLVRNLPAQCSPTPGPLPSPAASVAMALVPIVNWFVPYWAVQTALRSSDLHDIAYHPQSEPLAADARWRRGLVFLLILAAQGFYILEMLLAVWLQWRLTIEQALLLMVAGASLQACRLVCTVLMVRGVTYQQDIRAQLLARPRPFTPYLYG